MKSSLLFLLLILAQAGVAMTIGDLIESYDYDFYDGTINVTSFDDYMTDTNNNSINDTLIINLTTDATSATNYYVIVHLEDDTLITNYSNTTLSNTTNYTAVTFPTELLSKNQYNYTVEIRDEDFGLAYEKHKIQTQLYSDYETGLALINVTDENAGNLRITATLNVTRNETLNITAYLAYDNTTISATTEATLITPATTVQIDFENETIKRTHYEGPFNLTTIQAGTKSLPANHETASYDYEDFAETSYLKNVTAAHIDDDTDNLTDTLQFTVTIIAKTAEDATITATLHDPDLELVTAVNTTQSLSLGENTVTLNVSGQDIYSTYESGTFTLSTVTLNSSTSNDTLFTAYEEDLTYTDFEPPPRPDLTIRIDQEGANATITVANNGTAPAYNIIIDLFDDETYENQTVFQTLSINQSRSTSFLVPDQNALLTAIVDFDNIVDEKNETNNIANNIAYNIGITIEQLTTGTTRVFEATINNTGNQPLTSFTWSANLGDGTIVTGDPFNLTAGEAASILIEHTYAPGQQYTLTINATNTSLTAQDSLAVDLRYLKVENVTTLTDNALATVFEGKIANSGDIALDTVAWVFTTNGTIISSSAPLSLAVGENVTLLIEHTYPGYGTQSINLTVENATLHDEWISSVTIAELAIENLAMLASTGTNAIFTFDINELTGEPHNATWSFDSDDTGIIEGATVFEIAPNENVTVLIENNFTSTGTYEVTAGANTSAAEYTQGLNVTLS